MNKLPSLGDLRIDGANARLVDSNWQIVDIFARDKDGVRYAFLSCANYFMINGGIPSYWEDSKYKIKVYKLFKKLVKRLKEQTKW